MIWDTMAGFAAMDLRWIALRVEDAAGEGCCFELAPVEVAPVLGVDGCVWCRGVDGAVV